MKTDFLGRELVIGDQVVFMAIGYRDLMRGTITNLSPKKATIHYDESYMVKGELQTRRRMALQFYDQIVKVV